MAENLKLAKALREAEMRPTPRSGLTGMLADALMGARNFADRAKVPDFVPLIGGEGVGSLLVGKAPEEVNELSYGNLPIQMNPYAGRTASFVPEMKRGRGQQLADALSLLSLPGGKTAASMMMGAVPGVDAAATVFHGSPHKFDRFDSSKIGTGEGAQAYGHGLYVAEDPRVAQSYKDALGAGRGDRDEDTIARLLDAYGGDAAKASAELDRRAQYANIPGGKERLRGLAEQVRSGVDPRGSLYKVDLPDNAIARMLDWDKPLSQQAPEVQASIGPMFGPNSAGLTGQDIYKKAAAFDSMANVAAKTGGDVARMKNVFPQATDAQIQQAIAAAKNAGSNDRIAAQMLRDAGIPGIRYLDGGSRSAGQGSSNYVVFPGNESLLTILERNGQPLGTK
jgi:hypothetical protein